MSADPNGTRWSKSTKNFGKQILEKAGWNEGSGLGKEQQGTLTHVKVSRKDDVMGIGYVSGVQETWTTQSVGFADVLQRIKNKVKKTQNSNDKSEIGEDSEDENDSNMHHSPSRTFLYKDSEGDHSSSSSSNNNSSSSSCLQSPTSPMESRHFRRYAKRNALKTELLRENDERKKNEILGHHSEMLHNGNSSDDHTSSTHKRYRENDEKNEDSKVEKKNESKHRESKTGVNNNNGDSNNNIKQEDELIQKSSSSKRNKGKHIKEVNDDDDDKEEEENLMTLKSPMLRRLMVRCVEHEPKISSEDKSNEENNNSVNKSANAESSVIPSRVKIIKPHPRPPKCTVTPFHLIQS